MKLITLRNLPPHLARAIRQKAEKERASLNKTVIRLLEERMGAPGTSRKKILHHDLDALAGCWSREEARAFDRVLAEQRSLDPDLWK